MLRFTIALVSVSAAFTLGACTSVEPEGFLKMAGDTLDGEPIISDEDIPERKPNTSHIPDEETSGGILRWRAE